MRRIRLYDGYVEQVDDLEVDDLILTRSEAIDLYRRHGMTDEWEAEYLREYESFASPSYIHSSESTPLLMSLGEREHYSLRDIARQLGY